MKGISIVCAGIVALMATSALGQNATQADKPTSAQAAGDPGEILCERQKEIGSRIIVKKICMTRLQWQEHKRDDRDFTEKVQNPLGALRDGG